MKLICANCHEKIPKSVHPYTARIELFPRVEESIEFLEKDLEIDFDEEMKKIIGQLEAMNEEEQRLEEERVYSSFTFVLCPPCRDLLAARLSQNTLAS